MYRLCTRTFRKWKKKSCPPNPQGPLSKQHTSSCIESANNHVEEMAKQTAAEGAKGRKRGSSCLVSFSSTCTVLAQRRATFNCGWSDVNCLHGCYGAAVITKKCGDHEIFITKIFNYGIFSNFTKILNHENLELYGILPFPRFSFRYKLLTIFQCDTIRTKIISKFVKAWAFRITGTARVVSTNFIPCFKLLSRTIPMKESDYIMY